MQYSLHKGSIVKLRAKLMLQAWSPPTPVNHGLFFSFSFFPFYTFPFLFVTGKHLVSARNPRRVSSPSSLLSSLASMWCYSHTPLAALLTPTAPSFTRTNQTRNPPPILLTFRFALTQHLLHSGCCCCFSVTDRSSIKQNIS